MTDELEIRPAHAEPGRGLSPAVNRRQHAVPRVDAPREAILAELEERASISARYADWPEQVPGVPIGFMPGLPGPLCYDLDTHRLVLGKSGGGKATAVITYMLLHDDGHAVVLVDPKDGSIARVTAGYRQQLGPVHIVDPYNMTGLFTGQPCARFNPFDALDANSPTLVEDAAGLAGALCYLPAGGGNDNQYWDRQARSFSTALILHLVTDPGETADLLRFRELLTLPSSEFLAQVVVPMQENPACDGTVKRYANELSRLALAAPKGFEEVFSTIRSYVPWIEFQQLRAVTGRSTFDFASVREQGGTVYIVMDDDRLEECASWIRLMLQAARLGLKRSSSKRPVHFIIDEAAALGKFDLITTGLRAWRGAKIRLHLFYQDVSQIKAAFKDGWGSVANTDVLQFMGSNPGDLETAETISKIFGERDVIVPTSGESSSSTEGTSQSQATGVSRTDTIGTSSNKSRSLTQTRGSSWSTSTSVSHTVGVTQSSSTSTSSSSGGSSSTGSNGWPQSSTTYGSSSSQSDTFGTSESQGTSRSDTTGGSKSSATGETEGSGQSQSSAEGSSSTETAGTSRSESTSVNRSFTLQLRRTFRPEQVRMLPEDQMIVIAGNREPAIVYKEHFFRNPRLVARALTRYNPLLPDR